MYMKMKISQPKAWMLLTLLTLMTLVACQNKQEKQETPLTDKASMVKALEWQEAHPIHAISPTDWTSGVYYMGVARAHKSTDDQKYLAALKNIGHNNDGILVFDFFMQMTLPFHTHTCM